MEGSKYVTPVFKKDCKKYVTNYRPISLLPIISKVLEKCVLKQILPHFCDLLLELQFGFLKGRSCVSQLLTVLHEIGAVLDRGIETDVLYLDFSKAFDSISHVKLLLKLERFGVTGSMLDWFRNYLSNRKQRVVVEGVKSRWVPVISGVPQGSILRPFLFVLFVNDLPDVSSVGTKTVLFADDTKCYRPQRSQNDHLILQQDLKGLETWANIWDLDFNLKKCEVLRLTRKRDPPPRSYKLASNTLNETNQQRDLGIIVSKDLLWHNHVVFIVAKSNKDFLEETLQIH